MKRLAMMALPLGAVTILGVFGAIAARQGLLGEYWEVIWPALVAVGFLALGIGVFMAGFRTWAWPLGTGFVVQTLGVLLLMGGAWSEDSARALRPLYYTLGSVGIVLLIMGGLWLFVFLRARFLERRLIEGVGAGTGNEQQLADIRNQMKEALDVLRRAGGGRHLVYTLPWFLVTGRPAAGKTVAIRDCGLNFPGRRQKVQGVGGTFTLNFFFTNELIFLDTPGEWVGEDMSTEHEESWREVLRLLRKYRGQRPLDGVVVVVPAEDLLGQPAEALEDQAARIRDVINLLHAELRFRVPIYMVVSKCDLVDGFMDFIRDYPPKARDDVLGWSNERPGHPDPAALVARGFDRVLRQLEHFRLEMLARGGRVSRARRVFFFTENFKGLQDPLVRFAEVLFARDRFHEAPLFRGFYFTSGTQGEGSPFGQATNELAKALGVRPDQEASAAASDQVPVKSYFLLDLWQSLVAGDRGLVSRTAVHWLKRRRSTLAVAMLPACVGALILLLSLVSHQCNSSVYADIETAVPEAVDTLREESYTEDLEREEIEDVLVQLDVLRKKHARLVDFAPLRSGLGMRRPRELDDRLFELFEREFVNSALRPTLGLAEEILESENSSCTEKTEVLYAIVFLRAGGERIFGKSAETNEDLRGLDRIWGLSGEESRRIRRLLLGQFSYLRDNAVERYGTAGDSLLPGFDLARHARSLRDRCNNQVGSALEAYKSFLRECSDPVGSQVEHCVDRMNELISYGEQDLERLREHLKGLARKLESLKGEEINAEEALNSLRGFQFAEPSGDDCLKRFNDSILSKMRGFLPSDETIEACRKHVAGGNREERRERWQEWWDKSEKSRLGVLRESWNAARDAYPPECRRQLEGLSAPDVGLLERVRIRHLRRACVGEEKKEPRIRRVASSEVPHYELLESPKWPDENYTPSGWGAVVEKWNERLDWAEQKSGAAKRRDLEELRRDIQDYGRTYVDQWERFLGSLQWRKSSLSPAEWLQRIGKSDELDNLLDRVVTASEVASAAEEPMKLVADELVSLERVHTLVEGLPGYKRLLVRLSEDLKSFDGNADEWAQYRRDYQDEAPKNSLVEADDWVTNNVHSVPQARHLERLLKMPLDEAREKVLSDDLVEARRGELLKAFEEVVEKRPFSAADAADAVASDDELEALLQPPTGALYRYRNVVDEEEAEQSWVQGLLDLSRALYSDNGEPRELAIRVSPREPRFEPPEMGEDVVVLQVVLKLSEEAGQELVWKFAGADEGVPDPLQGKFSLVGPQRTRRARVSVKFAEKKGLFGRAFDRDNLSDPVLRPARNAESDGPWAAVEVLAEGMVDGLPQGLPIDLEYRVESVEYSGSESGTITIPFEVECEQLPMLLRLHRQGMKRPPGGAP